MKAFLIIFVLILAVIGGGGYYCYTQGHLDQYFGEKKQVVTGDPAKPLPPKGVTKEPTKPAPSKPVATTPKPTPPKPSSTPKPALTKAEKEAEAKYAMPNFKPLIEIVDNWNSVPQRAFPAAVTVKVPAEYQIKASDGNIIGSSKADAGHKAVPLQQKPGFLQVTDRPGGTALAVVKIDDTDFKEQIQALYDAKVAEAKERVLKARRVYATMLASQPEGAPASSGGDDPRFKPVRDHLAAGKIESAILEEAKEWYWLGSEVHDGRTYDVVMVNFEVDTIFGMFPNSMKALLSNGEVVKWVDSETGEERD